MARYVGARYVPIPMGEWDDTREYEPLSVVQYLGDSYTSKIFVPVGINILNTMYWIKTANFNQQIASMGTQIAAIQTQYDGEIEDLQDDVEELQNDLAAVEGQMNNLIGNFLHNDLANALQYWLVVEEKSINFQSVAAKAIDRQTISIASTGKTPIGVVGSYTASNNMLAGGGVINGTSLTGSIYNAGSAAGNGEVIYKVLYRVNNPW